MRVELKVGECVIGVDLDKLMVSPELGARVVGQVFGMSVVESPLAPPRCILMFYRHELVGKFYLEEESTDATHEATS